MKVSDPGGCCMPNFCTQSTEGKDKLCLSNGVRHKAHYARNLLPVMGEVNRSGRRFVVSRTSHDCDCFCKRTVDDI